MSMFGRAAPVAPGSEGEVVATFPTYEAAQKSVSSLIAAEIPARDIAIVGRGLRSIEKVTGKLGYATAARSGAVNGILLGLLFSLFFVFGNPDVAIQAFVGVMFVGIALGMLMGIVAYSIVRRRRDYASVMQVVADAYEVTVAPSSIGRARQTLGSRATAAPAAAARAVDPVDDVPPLYGERLPEPAPPRDAEPGVAGGDIVPVPPDEPVGAPPETAGPGEPAPGPDPDAPPVPPATRPAGV